MVHGWAYGFALTISGLQQTENDYLFLIPPASHCSQDLLNRIFVSTILEFWSHRRSKEILRTSQSPMRFRSLESQSYEVSVVWYHQAMNESMPHVSRMEQFELRLWRLGVCRSEEAVSTYSAIKNNSLHTCKNESADFVIRWEGPTHLRQPWPGSTKGDMPKYFFGLTRDLIRPKKVITHKLDATDSARIQLKAVCAYKRRVIVPVWFI